MCRNCSFLATVEKLLSSTAVLMTRRLQSNLPKSVGDCWGLNPGPRARSKGACPKRVCLRRNDGQEAIGDGKWKVRTTTTPQSRVHRSSDRVLAVWVRRYQRPGSCSVMGLDLTFITIRIITKLTIGVNPFGRIRPAHNNWQSGQRNLQTSVLYSCRPRRPAITHHHVLVPRYQRHGQQTTQTTPVAIHLMKPRIYVTKPKIYSPSPTPTFLSAAIGFSRFLHFFHLDVCGVGDACTLDSVIGGDGTECTC